MKTITLTFVLLAAILARAAPVLRRCESGSFDICAREADTQAGPYAKRSLFARQFDDFGFGDIFDGGFDFGFGSSDFGSDSADTADTEDPSRQSDSNDTEEDETPSSNGTVGASADDGVDASDDPADAGDVLSTADTAGAATADSSDTDNTSTSSANAAALTGNTCAASSTPPNAVTLSLIKEFEGFEPAPAPDPIGLPTVGFGHKCQQSGCAEVPFSFPLSQSTATSLLASDAQTFVDCLHAALGDNVMLNDNQFGALTAFAFNVGCGAVRKSTLLRRLNAGEGADTVASQELPKFNKAGGKVLAGLTRRRAAEVALFQTPSSTVAHPLC
ncbi:unnamed protein product [Cyclocybe aegerita]|uniref:Lysozyme n=1 Tax=Cyclocybe aegerita TaxID=1973307 RepID=A0A8S0WFG0_CYCAE|nr:unnamed protein product [Cyclocybe aegerita]